MSGSDARPPVRIVGPGRAGGALARALGRAGWPIADARHRGDDLADAAAAVGVVVIATPDDRIAEVARAIEPVAGTVVVHLAGSRGLDVLAPHHRRAGLHPLMALPDAELGARRLADGGWFAVAGDPIAEDMAASLGGRTFTVADVDRARYHATAVVASNHLVALLGQVERLARGAGVPMEPFLDLVRGTLANVEQLGAARALTGPAARGDTETIDRHLDAIDPSERELYRALVAAAMRLVGADPQEAG